MKFYYRIMGRELPDVLTSADPAEQWPLGFRKRETRGGVMSDASLLPTGNRPTCCYEPADADKVKVTFSERPSRFSSSAPCPPEPARRSTICGVAEYGKGFCIYDPGIDLTFPDLPRTNPRRKQYPKPWERR